MKEAELFEYLKASHFPGLIRSENSYDSFDCLDSTKGYYIELKCRHTHYPELLIEKSKYDRLNLEATFHALDPWYINSTPEGIWGFDLTRVPEPAWEERWMPTTTEFANTSKKTKVVGFLHTDYGLVL
jgi:hypothetical protein